MIVIYGLKNCDTCRKTWKWADEQGIAYTFKDLRADGFSEQTLDDWLAAVGWEALLNRRGTTWRGLSDSDKADVDQAKARSLMSDYPALIRRPVIQNGDRVTVGFTDEAKANLQG